MKNTFSSPITVQFHTLNVIFFTRDSNSLNPKEKCVSIKSTKCNYVELTCDQCALIMPLFYTNLPVAKTAIFQKCHFRWRNNAHVKMAAASDRRVKGTEKLLTVRSVN